MPALSRSAGSDLSKMEGVKTEAAQGLA